MRGHVLSYVAVPGTRGLDGLVDVPRGTFLPPFNEPSAEGGRVRGLNRPGYLNPSASFSGMFHVEHSTSSGAAKVRQVRGTILLN